jgi:hypothetical protein
MNRHDKFYVTGGAMPSDAASYVVRHADDEIFSSLSEGDYCYVLTPSQMGKSSLMAHTSSRLIADNVAVARVDLTGIGRHVDDEQWYYSLLLIIGRELALEDELRKFWDNEVNVGYGPVLRCMKAIRDIVLQSRPGRVVIFIDEIGVVTTLPFSADDFFAAVRELYNRRTSDAALAGVAFCFLGVATPSELLRDASSTAFNIGRRIELCDFTEAEASILARGLGRDTVTAIRVMKRIFYWTGGHPYLTQRLCRAVTEDGNVAGPLGVDRVCERLLLSPEALDREINLREVERQVLNRGDDRAAVLNLYRRVHRSGVITDGVPGHPRRPRWRSIQRLLPAARVPHDARNPMAVLLLTSGICREFDGYLCVRNRIYYKVFNKKWIKANFPGLERERQRIAYWRGIGTAALLVVLVTGTLMAFSWPLWQAIVNRAWATDNETAAERVLGDTHNVLRRYSDNPKAILDRIPEIQWLLTLRERVLESSPLAQRWLSQPLSRLDERKMALRAIKVSLVDFVNEYRDEEKPTVVNLKATTLYNRVLSAMCSDIGDIDLRSNYLKRKLQLMPSVKDVKEMPRRGANLIVVASLEDVLHFRVFDESGILVVDNDEKSVKLKTPHIDELRKHLADFRTTQDLADTEKDRVATIVMSILEDRAPKFGEDGALANFTSAVEHQKRVIALENKRAWFRTKPVLEKLLGLQENIAKYKQDLTSYYSGLVACCVRLGQLSTADQKVIECLHDCRGSSDHSVYFAWRLAMRVSEVIAPEWSDEEQKRLCSYVAQTLLDREGQISTVDQTDIYEKALKALTDVVSFDTNAAGESNRGFETDSVRHQAACIAATLGCRLRNTAWVESAIKWLKAELEALEESLKRETAPVQLALRTLQEWKADTTLAGLRDDKTIGEFPTSVQEDCIKTRTRVDNLLRMREDGSANQKHHKDAEK